MALHEWAREPGRMSGRISGHGRTILAGIAGNVMEWYDFTVYAYFAGVIGDHFFPSEDRVTSLIASFGVFAAGFLMRPFGSIVFGHIGDLMGRKVALTTSVIAMALPTFLIGLLPTYASVGAAAAVMLTALRLVQGLSVGGEYTTSFIFLVEQAAPGERGLLGSWGPFGAVGGILLGSATGAILTSTLDAAAIADWGWRLPFLVGILVGGTGLYLRRRLVETPPEGGRAHHGAGAPLVEAFRTQWRNILRVVGFNVIGAVGFYLCFVYVTTWLRKTQHLSRSTVFDINTLAMGFLLVLIPLSGMLSDRIGRKPLLLTAAGGMLLFSWPLLWLMHHPSPMLILTGQIGFALLFACFAGAGPAAMVETFPRRIRCTALSIGYNLTLALFGGTAPVVAIYTIKHSHDDLSPAFYLMAAAAVSLVVTLGLRETSRSPLT